MKLYARQRGTGVHYALLYGSGVIGSAIDHAISQQRAGWNREVLPWPWADSAGRATQSEVLSGRIGEADRIDVVWAAGASGFTSTDEAMAGELSCVAQVANLTGCLARRSRQTAFHLFSSAGGLFEGQAWIGPYSCARPERPYGRGKLRQEQLVMSLTDGVVPKIYRPSSVYGYTRHARRGLFTAMVTAILRNQPLVIYGAPGTLRDYVFSRDIGQHVAAALTRPIDGAGIAFLASGKPTSLAEAITTIETQLGRRLYHRYDSAPNNALNMTIHASAIPARFPRTPLAEGVALLLQNISKELLSVPYEPH